ncbi:MAG: hypothetical protein ABF290_06085, partial [Thiogranum sp.]
MNGVSDHYSLQHSADQDLARRAQASGLVYIALYTIIILFTRYANDHRTMAVLAGLTILVAATLRTWMILKFDSLYKLDPGAWLAGFSALTVLLAGVWGAFCAHTVLDYGLELTAMLTLLTTAGISAGAITTLSIRRDLILLCLMLLLLPSTVAALLQTTETLAIALL